MKRKKNFRWKNLGLVVLVTILVLSCFVVTGSLGKYVKNNIWNFYLSSKEFYFTSSKLDILDKLNVNSNWAGENIEIELKNSDGSDVTTYDIDYEASCRVIGDATASCKVNNKDKLTSTLVSNSRCVNTYDDTNVESFGKTECELENYDWVTTETINPLLISVILDPEQEYDVLNIRVTVKSTGPYSKTLQGTFELHKTNVKKDQVFLDYNSKDDYGILVINNTYSVQKYVTLTWNKDRTRLSDPGTLITKYTLDGYINSICVQVPRNSSVDYTFYDVNSRDIISTSDFEISTSDEPCS